MAYGPDQIDQWRGAATYADRILEARNLANCQFRHRPSTSW